MHLRPTCPLWLVAALFAPACGPADRGAAANTDTRPVLPVDDQRPPTTGSTDLEAWLAGGAYRQWACEPDPHAVRSPSGHSRNRICSNALLSGAGFGEYPVDAASVKELYNNDSSTIIGYAVYRHTRAGAGDDAWYWYERIGRSVIADGLGVDSNAKGVCVSCHSQAGKRSDFPGHDFVFTQVR